MREKEGRERERGGKERELFCVSICSILRPSLN